MNNTTTAKGFFQTLFDFNFESFLTLKFLKVIYAIFTALLLLAGLIWLVVMVASGEPAGIFIGLVAVPVITLLYLVLTRITFEMIALFFRIGENTSAMARSMGAGGFGSGPAPVPAGPTGPSAPATRPAPSGPHPTERLGGANAPQQPGPGSAGPTGRTAPPPAGPGQVPGQGQGGGSPLGGHDQG